MHDAITLVRGSLKKSLDAARFLTSQGLRVILANVLMVQNLQDYSGVRALAEEMGVECRLKHRAITIHHRRDCRVQSVVRMSRLVSRMIRRRI